jgi:F-type H+-transporting ATPase subunit b
MHIASNIALISINGTLFIQLISFLIFLFIINRLMFRPLQGVMNERDNHIEKIKQDIVDTENEFKDLTNKLQQQESAVKDEAFGLKQELEAEANRQAAEIFVSVRDEIEAIKEKAQKEIDAQISETRKDIEKESEALASSIMEKILDRRLVP